MSQPYCNLCGHICATTSDEFVFSLTAKIVQLEETLAELGPVKDSWIELKKENDRLRALLSSREHF